MDITKKKIYKQNVHLKYSYSFIVNNFKIIKK